MPSYPNIDAPLFCQKCGFCWLPGILASSCNLSQAASMKGAELLTQKLQVDWSLGQAEF